MKVSHFTLDVATASGVVTFVRELNESLAVLGIESRITHDVTELTTDSDRPDVVHIHGLWRMPYHAVAKWAKRSGVRLVWSTHGMTAPWSMRHKWWKKLPAWWMYQRGDLLSADRIHSTSPNEIQWNQSRGLDKQVLIPLGTHLPILGNKAAHRPRKTLLCVGRLHPVKAMDRLIEAFARVPSCVRAGWRLRLVGPNEAWHEAVLRQICAREGLVCQGPSSEVDFAGPLFGAELAAEYASCDCLALVSHTENFGATVVDAMAYGKPVLTSTRTPWDEVGVLKCGWWVDNSPEELARTLEQMMSLSDSEREEMGRRGRELVERKYTWDAVGKSMIEVYEEVLHGC